MDKSCAPFSFPPGATWSSPGRVAWCRPGSTWFQLAAAFFAIAIASATAAEPVTYEADFVSNYDADTWTVVLEIPVEYEAVTAVWVDRIDLSVTVLARVTERVRVVGIDTPEIRGAGCQSEKALAREARDAVRAKAQDADLFAVEIDIDGREKYGRALGDILIDGERVSEWLMANGYAKPYDGTGPRPSWCADGS